MENENTIHLALTRNEAEFIHDQLKWCFDHRNASVQAVKMFNDLISRFRKVVASQEEHGAQEEHGVNIQLSEVQVEIRRVCDMVANMLIKKNQSYGNSALNPIRVFSKSNTDEQIKVRLDDKLSRLARGSNSFGEDIIMDLLGYLIFLYILELRKNEGPQTELPVNEMNNTKPEPTHQKKSAVEEEPVVYKSRPEHKPFRFTNEDLKQSNPVHSKSIKYGDSDKEGCGILNKSNLEAIQDALERFPPRPIFKEWVISSLRNLVMNNTQLPVRTFVEPHQVAICDSLKQALVNTPSSNDKKEQFRNALEKFAPLKEV